MDDVVRAHPEAEVQVWAEDEARFGLIPTTRRVWAPRGRRPSASSKRKYQWSYLYSFVHPQTGKTVHILGSTVSAEAMSKILEAFAQEAGLGPQRQAVLVIDGAGWHTAAGLRLPEGLHLAFLPPYSPELQPAERLWPLIAEVTANRNFASLADLQTAVGNRCNYLHEHPDIVRRLTHYHWWPKDHRYAQ